MAGGGGACSVVDCPVGGVFLASQETSKVLPRTMPRVRPRKIRNEGVFFTGVSFYEFEDCSFHILAFKPIPLVTGKFTKLPWRKFPQVAQCPPAVVNELSPEARVVADIPVRLAKSGWNFQFNMAFDIMILLNELIVFPELHDGVQRARLAV